MIRELWRWLFGRRPSSAAAGPVAAPTTPVVPAAPAPAAPPDALETARRAFVEGRMEDADGAAAAGLAAIDAGSGGDGADPARRAARTAALLGVRGGVAARASRWEDALEWFGRALAEARSAGEAPGVAAAMLNLLDVRTRKGERRSDDPLFDEVAQVARGTPYEDVLGKLLVERGVAAASAGELPEAIRLFDRAVELRPAWPFPWYQRAWTRFLAGDAAGALEDYRECAKCRRPFFTVQREIRCLEDVAAGRLPLDAYRSYCVVRERVRTQAAAVEESAGRLVARYPDFAPGYLLRAEARLAQGDADGAGEAARAALAHDPDEDTAAAALFLEWNIARARAQDDVLRSTEERLLEAYGDSPAAAIVRRLREIGRRDVALRWTWALDGTFRLDEGVLVPRPEGGSS